MKVTEFEKQRIKTLYKRPGMTITFLAKKFERARETITRIINNQYWEPSCGGCGEKRIKTFIPRIPTGKTYCFDCMDKGLHNF